MNQTDLKQIDKLLKKRDKLLEKQFKLLEKQFVDLPTKKYLDKRLNEVLEKRLNEVIEDIGNLIKDFSEVLDEKKANKTAVTDLERRVIKLENPFD